MDSVGHSSTSVPVVAGTSTPKPKFKRRLPSNIVSPGLRRDVATLKASGMRTTSIAKTLGKQVSTIHRTLALPDVQESVQELRRVWKAESQAKVTDLVGEVWNMASSFVEQRDSKSFDNTLRGIAAMEKVSASISGEGQKVEVTGTILQPPQVELKVLIGQIFGKSDAT